MKNNLKNTYAVIMAGGIGSRFWPTSRETKPKQFLDILGTNKTLLQTTYNRFKNFLPKENIIIVTLEKYKHFVKDQLPNLPQENILGEPEGKNTGLSICYVTHKLYKKSKEIDVIIAPADHLILGEIEFINTCRKTLRSDELKKNIFTIGIKPHMPHTGYGYIEFKKIKSEQIFDVSKFIEKPNLEKAKQFYLSKKYLWNAGIFISNIEVLMEAFRQTSSKINNQFEKNKNYFDTKKEFEALTTIYKNLESVSFDYAVLEKAKNIKVVKASFEWSDLGSWTSIYNLSKKDENRNALIGDKIFTNDSFSNLIKVPNKKLAFIQGLHDYIIIDTEDALLICKTENEQKIKEYITEIKKTNQKEYCAGFNFT